MARLWTLLMLVALLLAGCFDRSAPDDDIPDDPDPAVPGMMTFATFNVPAVHTGHGLYEPTIDVSDGGTLYISSHSTGIGVVPAPGYYSTDDGVTWATLPLAGPAATPPQGQGSAPLFSDEIFIVAGPDGSAWGVDINLRDYIITGWCGDGSELCYYNPNAYDHVQTVLQAATCTPVPLKDRPWAAYNNGMLLMVNNPGGGPAQIASMQVPPPVPADVGPVLSGIQWNLCASSGGGIPGIPDMDHTGFFAVPQMQGGDLIVITGNISNVMETNQVRVFANSNQRASEVINSGHAAFDADTTLFVGAMSNSNGTGGIQLAFSRDGETFVEHEFTFDRPVSTFYLDGNRYGPGALLNWGLVGDAGTDYFFGHLYAEGGSLVLHNVNLAVEAGPEASRHVQGAAIGPDGRAYMVMSDVSGNDSAAMAAAVGTMPLHVVVQQDGPILPVVA